MDQNSYPRENRGPYLRRISPAKRNPRLMALAGFGAGAAFACAVAAAVYLNAVSNPPIMESVPADKAVVAGEAVAVPVNEADARRVTEARTSAPPPAPEAQRAVQEPAVLANAAAAKTRSASSDGVAEPEPALAPSAVTVVQSPLEPKRVTTVVIRPDAPVPSADDPRWAAAASVPRNKALDALREKLAASEDASVEESTPDQTVTAALAPADPPKGQPVSRSVAPEVAPVKTSKKALISEAVKLRARPDGKSAVVGVLPARAEVQLGSCKGWCQVSYQGKSGYVWKSFVRPAKPLNALAGG